MKSNDLSRFKFERNGSGCYRVIYTTPVRGDYYVAEINDMWLIDATKNAEYAKLSDILRLRAVVIRKGVHYSSRGGKL